MTPINSIQIPAEFVQLCREWVGPYPTNDMLFAIVSTGGLTLGTKRPDGCDTDEKWYLRLWRELSCDVSYARHNEGKEGNNEEAKRWAKFEKWVDEQVAKLEAEYGLADWLG